MSKNNLPLAHPLVRLLAWLIDVSFSVLVTLLGLLLVSQSVAAVELIPNIILAVTVSWILFPLMYFFVNPYLMTKFGGGIGKLATGLIVVNDEGHYLSYWRSLFRNTVGYIISNAFFCLGFIWIWVDKQRQGWHDQIIGSYVRVSQGTGVVIGLIVLVLLGGASVFVANSLVENFTRNEAMYQEVFNSLQEEELELESSEATPEATPFLMPTDY